MVALNTHNAQRCALVQAAYPQFNEQYHWQELCTLLGQYHELTKNQARLQRLGWRSIEAGVDQAELVLNRVLIRTTFNPKYSLKQQGEYAADLCAAGTKPYYYNETIVAVNHSEQKILLMPKHSGPYSIWIMRLLKSNLNFSLTLSDNFNSRLPTVDHAFLEQYKQKRVEKITALLKGPLEPLLLIMP